MSIEQQTAPVVALALPVLDAELVSVDVLADVMPQPLRYPPAVIEREPVFPICRCGKRAGDDYAHGGLTCQEVLDIRARVAHFTMASPRGQFVHTMTGCGNTLTHEEFVAAKRKREAQAAQPHRAVRRLFRRIRGGA